MALVSVVADAPYPLLGRVRLQWPITPRNCFHFCLPHSCCAIPCGRSSLPFFRLLTLFLTHGPALQCSPLAFCPSPRCSVSPPLLRYHFLSSAGDLAISSLGQLYQCIFVGLLFPSPTLFGLPSLLPPPCTSGLLTTPLGWTFFHPAPSLSFDRVTPCSLLPLTTAGCPLPLSLWPCMAHWFRTPWILLPFSCAHPPRFFGVTRWTSCADGVEGVSFIFPCALVTLSQLLAVGCQFLPWGAPYWLRARVDFPLLLRHFRVASTAAFSSDAWAWSPTLLLPLMDLGFCCGAFLRRSSLPTFGAAFHFSYRPRRVRLMTAGVHVPHATALGRHPSPYGPRPFRLYGLRGACLSLYQALLLSFCCSLPRLSSPTLLFSRPSCAYSLPHFPPLTLLAPVPLAAGSPCSLLFFCCFSRFVVGPLLV